MDKKRVIYLDLLRVISCFLVIMVHVSAQFIEDFGFDTFSYRINDLYNTIAIIGPGMFFAISGAIFLNPALPEDKVSVKKIYGKYILRMVVAYVLWSWFYTITNWWGYYPLNLETIKLFIKEFCLGRPMYHMWFIPYLIVLYMLLPVLRPGLADRKRCRYFVILYFVIEVVIATVMLFDFEKKDLLEGIFGRFNFALLTGHVGFFALGYYLSVTEYKNWQRYVFIAIAVLTVAVTRVSDWSGSVKTGERVCRFSGLDSIGAFLMIVALFVLFKHLKFKEGKGQQVLGGVAKLTFGIYLLHPYILDRVIMKHFGTLAIPLAIRTPLYSLVIFIICAAIIWVISKIPFVNKYIV